MNIHDKLVDEYWELVNNPCRTFEQWWRFIELQQLLDKESRGSHEAHN